MTDDSKTPNYMRKAIKRYESHLVRKVINFDTRKPEDVQMLERIDQDGRSTADILRSALKKEFDV